MTNYIVLDIETTGLDTTKDVPIQLAYESYSLDVPTQVFFLNKKGAFYIKPRARLSPEIIKITGITDSLRITTIVLFGLIGQLG